MCNMKKFSVVAFLVMRQLYYCPGEVATKNISQINSTQTTTKRQLCTYLAGDTLYMVKGAVSYHVYYIGL